MRSFTRLLPFACALALQAATLQQLTTPQLVTASTAIIRGTITGSKAAWSNRTIYTHYTVQVTEQWKGATVATADVALPGGALNGVRQSYPGVPGLPIGGDYVLFLWTGKSGMTQITGYDQGIYAVGPGSQGQLLVSRQASGELMVGQGGQPIADHAVNMSLGDFRTAVATVLQGANQK